MKVCGEKEQIATQPDGRTPIGSLQKCQTIQGTHEVMAWQI